MSLRRENLLMSAPGLLSNRRQRRAELGDFLIVSTKRRLAADLLSNRPQRRRGGLAIS